MILIIPLLALYFVPTIAAFFSQKKNAPAILALNLLTGWTFIGWVVSLVWAIASEHLPEDSVKEKIENNADVSKKYFVVSNETNERIQGFYTDDGALKCIDECGLSVTKVYKNSEGGMDFIVTSLR